MGRKRTSNQTHRAHAGPALGADDHVVVHRHLHVPPGLDQVARQADVLCRGRRIADGPPYWVALGFKTSG
jgi:hypothetical protein